jgi:hypothetical protein
MELAFYHAAVLCCVTQYRNRQWQSLAVPELRSTETGAAAGLRCMRQSTQRHHLALLRVAADIKAKIYNIGYAATAA